VAAVIGITGGIGTGKSTVLKLLAELGAETIDADRLAQQVMVPDGPAYHAIVDAFGPEILADDGQINRRKLGGIVFADPAALQRLEQLVHPAVIQRTRELLQTTEADVVAIEAIKLIESGMARELCDVVWIVTSKQSQQVRRVVGERGMSEADVLQRIAAQPSAQEHAETLDERGVEYVMIDNNGLLEELRAQVHVAWQHLCHTS
jgi:dephospho-CoA kinase